MMNCRESFESAVERHIGKKPMTWSAIESGLPNHLQGSYFLKEHQFAWEMWKACWNNVHGLKLNGAQRMDLRTASFCVAAVGDPTCRLAPADAERIIGLLEQLAGGAA